MNVALAGMLPAAFYQEDDIAEQPLPEYLWSDLAARRQALNLSIDDVAALLRMDLTRYRSHESGARDLRGPARGLVDELAAMETFVADETALLIAGAATEGTVELHAIADQDTFTAGNPDARTRRDQTPYPVSLQHVAVGRAAAGTEPARPSRAGVPRRSPVRPRCRSPRRRSRQERNRTPVGTQRQVLLRSRTWSPPAG